MKIAIHAQILSGDIGDGWNDEYAAAQALADYANSVWRNDLSKFIEAGHEVSVEIEVQRASGDSRDLYVYVAPFSNEGSYELKRQVEAAMTDEGEIWERFCSSPEAKAHFSE